MYKNPFYLTECLWNNALSYEKRTNKKLFVPNLIEISDMSQIELWDEVVFEDYDFDDNLISAKWLKNFYKISWKNKDIYLFDNHNHALYFWYLAKSEGIIGENNILYHVDEHADTRIPEKIISKGDAENLEKIFEYTNFWVNVGNYIIPAVENNLINEVIQIRSESDLLAYDFQKKEEFPVILNLDLDFFEPNLDYIEYTLKKKVILDIAKKAKVITIATSPFFIDQELALKVFKDLFAE